jgi:hypothetical protein
VWERNGDGRQVIGGDQLDLESDRLSLLFWFDKDMTAGRTTFGCLGMERYP